MKSYFITDQGQVRSINEDAGGIFYNASGHLLAIVADGMGGHQAGEVASQLAISTAEKEWSEQNNILTPKDAEEWLANIIQKMNDTIFEHAKQNKAYEGMGTTVVMAICTDECISIAHVGDSRAYLLGNNQYKQLTEDHSLVNELIRTGQISEIDAQAHPRKNVLLRAVGTEKVVQPDIETIGWSTSSDCLLLCSDGLTNKITDDELQQLFETSSSLESLTKELIHIANERGGEDNITIAMIKPNGNYKVGDGTC